MKIKTKTENDPVLQTEKPAKQGEAALPRLATGLGPALHLVCRIRCSRGLASQGCLWMEVPTSCRIHTSKTLKQEDQGWRHRPQPFLASATLDPEGNGGTQPLSMMDHGSCIATPFGCLATNSSLSAVTMFSWSQTRAGISFESLLGGPGDQCLCAVTLPQEGDGLVTGT